MNRILTDGARVFARGDQPTPFLEPYCCPSLLSPGATTTTTTPPPFALVCSGVGSCGGRERGGSRGACSTGAGKYATSVLPKRWLKFVIDPEKRFFGVVVQNGGGGGVGGGAAAVLSSQFD